MPENWQKNGFGVYVHWPFCQAKCPYCDFNSHVSATVDHAAWEAAFRNEIIKRSDFTEGRVISSVFFGGGTPSLMKPKNVETILKQLQVHHTFANDVEITLEANPTSVEANTFVDFAAAGVNRVSLGIQALNDVDLKRLGRLHSSEDAVKALDRAQQAFSRVSFDLIYARQHQALEDWEKELKRALSFGTEHLSLYQLTIEDGTAFGDRFAKGMLAGLPSDDLSVDMYETTFDICETAGLHRYEVSNYAKRGAESRHNLIYWNGGDYLGIGPGAHGRLSRDNTRFSTIDPKAPGLWLLSCKEDKATSFQTLSMEDWSEEALIMGLRLESSFELEEWAEFFQRDLSQDTLNDLEQLGLISFRDGQLTIMQQGRPLLNGIIAKILG